jgi:hypothetical protein
VGGGVVVGTQLPDTTTLIPGLSGESGGNGIEQAQLALHVAVASHTSRLVFHFHSHFAPHGFCVQVYVLELPIEGIAGGKFGAGGQTQLPLQDFVCIQFPVEVPFKDVDFSIFSSEKAEVEGVLHTPQP